jgi:hypothetical protein
MMCTVASPAARSVVVMATSCPELVAKLGCPDADSSNCMGAGRLGWGGWGPAGGGVQRQQRVMVQRSRAGLRRGFGLEAGRASGARDVPPDAQPSKG